MIDDLGFRASLQQRRASGGQMRVGAFPYSRRSSFGSTRRASHGSLIPFDDVETSQISRFQRNSSSMQVLQGSNSAERSSHSYRSIAGPRYLPELWNSPNFIAADQNHAAFHREETDAWTNAFAIRNRIPAKHSGEPDLAKAEESQVANTFFTKVCETKLFGVREDYYSILMCSFSSWIPDPWKKIQNALWDLETRKLVSKVCQDSVFSLNHHMLQSWSTQLGQQRFPDPLVDRKKLPSYDRPTGIAVSKIGFVVITYQGGKIVVRDLLDPNNVGAVMLSDAVKQFNYENETEDSSSIADESRGERTKQNAFVTHVLWCQLSPAEKAGQLVTRLSRKAEGFVGDLNGRVFKFAVERNSDLDQTGLVIKIIATIPTDKFHIDSICSMALDSDEKRLAVAGTDNIVRIWRHDSGAGNPAESLVYLNDVPQFSAVRSLCFSPMKSDLLLTGGGRHDRTLRVFDANQTDALYQIAMPAQIVGIVWLNYTEVFVAFGHSRLNKYRGYGKVVDILKGQIVAELPGKGYLLTALKTQNGFCVHTNQSSLISYTWNCQSKKITSGEIEDAYKFSPRSPQLR